MSSTSWHPADVPGLPTYTVYKLLEAKNVCDTLYLPDQEKTIITRALFNRLRNILDDSFHKTDRNYRLVHWAYAYFKLGHPPPRPRSGTSNHQASSDVVTLLSAGGLVVAVREQLYPLLCYFHQRTGHGNGGLEKMYCLIREYYSYVPRELVRAFVKACPTCTAAGSMSQDSIKFVHWQPFLGGALATSSYTLHPSKRMPMYRTIQLRPPPPPPPHQDGSDVLDQSPPPPPSTIPSKGMQIYRPLPPPPPPTLRALRSDASTVLSHPRTPPSNTATPPAPLLLPSLRYHPNMLPSSAPRSTSRVRKSPATSHIDASDIPAATPGPLALHSLSPTRPFASNSPSTPTHTPMHGGGLPRGWEIILRPLELESRGSISGSRGSASLAMGREQGQGRSPARAHPYKPSGGHERRRHLAGGSLGDSSGVGAV